MLHRIAIRKKRGFKDFRALNLRRRASEWLGIQIDKVTVADVYLIEGKLSNEEIDVIVRFLVDPIIETTTPEKHDFDFLIQIGFKPGVKDTVGERAAQAVYELTGNRVKVSKLIEFFIAAGISREEVRRIASEILANELIHNITVFDSNSNSKSKSKSKSEEPAEKVLNYIPVVVPSPTVVKEFGLDEIKAISKTRNLALLPGDFRAIKDYFASKRAIKERKKYGLSGITDVELEMIAQTQSEHCKHRIFNALIQYKANGKTESINSLFNTFIRRATEEIKEKEKEKEKRKVKGSGTLLSVFSDNAGIIEFDGHAVAMKVETHNSPSAKEPYGGAITGIVGVYRDILGAGKGARLIAGSYGFCTANPQYKGDLIPGISPRRLLEGIVEGVRDGGNKSGVPTIFGYSKYDDSFLGKPLVYVGALGILPKYIGTSGEKSWEKKVDAGDLIVMAGGRVGRDGIHGVTEASLEYGEYITAGHVQIGDPYTQKNLHDFLIEARDKGLYKLVWDCGGGGLSSAVGETARFSNGCELWLEKVPLKYEGLHPWEILVSESQERMILGVDPSKLSDLKHLAKTHEVKMAVIGEYKKHGRFLVMYKGRVVGCIDLDFLHNGFPQLKLEAEWDPAKGPYFQLQLQLQLQPHPQPKTKQKRPPVPKDHKKLLIEMLSRPNVASKEWIQRQYDHEVQGTSIIKPLAGCVSSDASVIAPLYNEKGLALASANCFKYSAIDTYWMAACSLDEAIRRVISVGASPDRIVINDNFCWPNPLYSKSNPEGKKKLGMLVRACKSLYRFTKEFNTPCISGKDSMFIDGNLRDKNGKVQKVSGLPALQITALGMVDNVEKCVNIVPKHSGDLIYLIGDTKEELGASEYYELLNEVGGEVPKVDPEKAKVIYRVVSDAVSKGLIESCKGCYRGGLIIALAEMAIASSFGIYSDLGKVPGVLKSEELIMYSETPSRFVITVKPENASAIEEIFLPVPHARIGHVSENFTFTVRGLKNKQNIIEMPVSELEEYYKKTFRGL